MTTYATCDQGHEGPHAVVCDYPGAVIAHCEHCGQSFTVPKDGA